MVLSAMRKFQKEHSLDRSKLLIGTSSNPSLRYGIGVELFAIAPVTLLIQPHRGSDFSPYASRHRRKEVPSPHERI